MDCSYDGDQPIDFSKSASFSKSMMSFSSSPLSSPSSPSSPASPSSLVISNAPSRKKGTPLPDVLKDEAYWERRKRNNEAAKRSRDARRAKELSTIERAKYLEEENLRLSKEVEVLKHENTTLRCFVTRKLGLNDCSM